MRLLCLGAAAVFTGCVGAAPDGPGDDGPGPQEPTTPTLTSVAAGSFHALSPYTGIDGRAQMVRQLDGKTEISIAATGLTATTMYTAHLHNAPCQFLGGTHYKIDPAVVDTVETNEIWVKGQSTDKGVLAASTVAAHLTRGEALSVVIHDPNAMGAKMACADLYEPDVGTIEMTGTIAPIPGSGADPNIGGTVTASRSSAGTTVTLNATGLDPAGTAYIAHVHAEPCDVTAGGGHYKLDTTVVTAVEANEMWLAMTTYTTGTNMTMIAPTHPVRTDAQAVVIHKTINATPVKVGCANLTRKTAQKVFDASGDAIALAAAAGMSLTGTAIMERKLTGVTSIALVMTGLAPNTTYKAHVHNQPCSVESGGGHYKIDPSITDTAEANEIWFELKTDADGSGSDATWTGHTLRADAMSIVLHGTDTRLACFDLR